MYTVRVVTVMSKKKFYEAFIVEGDLSIKLKQAVENTRNPAFKTALETLEKDLVYYGSTPNAGFRPDKHIKIPHRLAASFYSSLEAYIVDDQRKYNNDYQVSPRCVFLLEKGSELLDYVRGYKSDYVNTPIQEDGWGYHQP